MAVTLYDQFGHPIDRALLKEEQAAPTITGVRQIMTGHPAQGLTPERLMRILREAETGDPMRYLELAEEMEERDLHYLSVLGTRKRSVAQLDIAVESVSDDAVDIANADLVRAAFNALDMEDAIIDLLDAVGKGFAVVEIVWDTDGRAWWVERLEWRDQRFFLFDPVDGRTLTLRGENGQPEPLTPAKFIIHTHKAKSGLPIRGGLARVACWSWLFKSFDVKSWVLLAEVYGHPLRLGKYGRGATEADKRTLLTAVRNIAQDAAAIIPQEMMIDFVEATMSGRIDLFERLADWLDRQVSKAVLGQTLTTEVSGGGSYAAAKVHGDVRADIERSDAKQVARAITNGLVRPLLDLNGRNVRKGYPLVRIGRPAGHDVTVMSQALATLVPLGLTVEASVVRDRLGFPDPAKDAVLLRPPAPVQPTVQPETPPPARTRGPRAPERPSPPHSKRRLRAVKRSLERHGPRTG